MERSDKILPQQIRNSSSSSFSSSRVSSGYVSRQISNDTPETSRVNPRNSTNKYGHVRDWNQRKNNVQKTRESQEKRGAKEEGNPNEASFIIGTCPFMCPEKERAQRERLRDLAVFERLNGNPAKSSAFLAVKKFSRTISTQDVQATDLRPLPVLEETLKYLIEFLESKQYPFEIVHDFIFDRTRSIRQDLSMQDITNSRAIYLYEEMVKFHVMSHSKLQSCNSPNIASLHHLNMEQLTKALLSLYNLYGANRNTDNIHKNEAEFHSLYVLLQINQSSQPVGESLSLWFRRLPAALARSRDVCFARRVLRYFRMGNYKGFLSTTASEASYLQFCLIEPHINEIRAGALACINSVGYKLHPYPISQLSKLMVMKESDVESFCNSCGLDIVVDAGGIKALPTKQTKFSLPKERLQGYNLVGLERFKRSF